jgi:serine/threonine protein kinase
MANPSVPPSRSVPSKIGRYEILRELGRGGMAFVYLGFDPNFRREVAIKVLPREALDDPVLFERFQREARTIAALEHSAIVPVYDFGEDDGRPFLVMRYLNGGSLASRISKGPMPIAEAAKVLTRIGSALDSAHARGIVHRDLKPANILFDQFGDSYLSDFGIAQIKEAATNLTGSSVIGTPAYMSPEQIRSEAKVDARSDIYALGIVLFEMLTGTKPFRADTPAKMMMQHLESPVPRLPEGKTGLPADINGVLIRAMAKDPDLRFQKASDLGNAVSDISSGKNPSLTETAATNVWKESTGGSPREGAVEPSTPRRVAKARMTARKPRKNRLVWAAIGLIGLLALLALVFIVGSGGMSFLATQKAGGSGTPIAGLAGISNESTSMVSTAVWTATAGNKPANGTVISSENAGSLGTLMQWETGAATSIDWSPDGKSIAIASSAGIHIYNVETRQETAFLDAGDQVKSIAFSPDGRSLVSGSEDKTVKAWNAADGKLIRSFQASMGVAGQVAFSPDGGILAVGSWDSNVRLWNFSDGNLLRTLKGHSQGITSLIFSPDGSRLASGSGDRKILVWQVKDGAILLSLDPDASNGIPGLAYSPDGRMLVSASYEKEVQIWNTDDGTLARALVWESDKRARSVSFSPNGSLLIVGGMDGVIQIWNAADWSLRTRLTGHTDEIFFARISPDGTLLASGSTDGTVRIWGF